MKNVIGNPARGNDFFPRKREIEKIIRRIEAGGHIQLTAPRRVGKTSILMHFLDNPVSGYYFVYIDTEGIEEQDQYFKKIYEEIFRSEAISRSAKFVKQIKEGANKFLSRVKGVKVFDAGIELNEAAGISYYDELLNFIKGIELEGEKIILLNDEFPYTIENIIAKNEGNPAAALSFLKISREFRTDPDISSKLQIIYTGSIGLNALVERIGKTELVNDINSVAVNPLHENEARQMIEEILGNYGYKIDEQAAGHLLHKIEWLIPFHIQLALAEIMDSTAQGESITNKTIDNAFSKIVEYKNNNYFDNYYSRLRKHFKKEQFTFAEELLCEIAKRGRLGKNEIFNLAVKRRVADDLRSILGTLVYDGYINNNDQPEVYRFNSPIIKMWWQKYVCN